MNPYPHLNQATRAVVDLSKEARINYIKKPIWIAYPRAQKLLQILGGLKDHPVKTRMPNLLIIGEPFMGKTSILEKFLSMNPNIGYTDDDGIAHTQVPVTMISAPEKPTMRNFYIKILEQYWTSFRHSDTEAKLQYQAIHLMRETRTRLLIIDEIHNLLETTMTNQRLIMNGIKNLSNELKIPIVGAGTQTAVKVLSSDPQHASRFDVVRLGKWELDAEYRGLLKAFEQALPLPQPSNLASKEKAKLLFYLSGGNLGNLHKLLMACAEYAIEHEHETISMEVIEANRWVKPPSEGMPAEIPL